MGTQLQCGGWFTNDRPEYLDDECSLLEKVEKLSIDFTSIIEKRKKDRPKLEIVFEPIKSWQYRYYDGSNQQWEGL